MLYLVVLSAAVAADPPALTAGPVEPVAEDLKFTEGPLWLPAGELVFSDIPADTIYRGDGTVFRTPSGKSNGLTLDRQGRLIACEHWNRRVSRTAKDGAVTVLADRYQGKLLNSPNDVVVRSDSSIYFTDPPYGLEKRPAELEFSGVYLLPPDGELRLVFDGFDRPNGLAFSPDEKTLYIGDSGASIIHAFDVAADGTLSNGHLFCECPGPDGMKVDQRGRLWTSASDGIRIYGPDGAHLETVAFPLQPTNCAFGGPDSKTLFVTAR
ncbi:MAG: SMP-30/gluconolactonase/LRE family protein, partial [Candidatus Hydrogenedentes bacterium]|nr:SMP-30/gluconolactonase/LRE family protein [Candidatus Hydrogenedentota bacterium]